MMNYIAQQDLPLAPNGGFKGFGNYGLEGSSAESSAQLFNSFISRAIAVMTVVAFIWFVFSFFTGAIGILSSGGDKQGLESAKKKITTGVIGIVVIIAAVFVISLMGRFLGVENILNPAYIIENTIKNTK